jgi:hypothetical protein
MTNFGPDSLLGWHVLIPPRRGRRVHLAGFPPGAAAFWTARRGETVVEDAARADLRLYLEPAGPVIPGPEGYASLGRGAPARLVGGHASPRLHLLLPAALPRLVLPLWDRSQIRRGLRLHRPGRVLPRVAARLAAAAPALMAGSAAAGRVLAIAHDRAPDFGAEAVLYLGTPGPARTTTILPAARDRILKRADTPEARLALSREATALERMRLTPLAARIPRLHAVSEGEHHAILDLEYRAPRAAPALRVEAAIVAFLAALARIDRAERPLASLPADWRARLPPALAAGAGSRPVPGHRAHGDFAPWNLAWTSDGLFVFDWEDSADWAPAFSDAFSYVLAPALHVARRPDPEHVTAAALAFARRVAAAGGGDPADIRLSWHLFLARRQALKPHPLLERLIGAGR